MRDLRVHQILEGTNEIMRVIIARELFRSMTDEPDVITRVEGAVGRLTLNRPAALHALNTGMCAAMTEALLAWRGDPAVEAGPDRPCRRARLLRRRRHPHAGGERGEATARRRGNSSSPNTG